MDLSKYMYGIENYLDFTWRPHMTNAFTDTLSHSGREMLGGMSIKPSIDISSYTGKVTIVPSKETRPHSLRTKSHMKGGKHSRYNMGGRNSKQSRSTRYVKHA